MKTLLIITGLCFVSGLLEAGPLSTGFTYHGQLSDSGAPANGTYDLTFTLYNDAVTSTPATPSLVREDVVVVRGVFMVDLDFGEVFAGTQRWLGIAVRPGDSTGTYTPFTPRQQILAAPYATYAVTAGTADTASLAEHVRWLDILGVPAGFADGVDNERAYFAGNGLDLSANTFSIAPGRVDRDMITDGAITPGKISPIGFLAGQVLKFDGARWLPGNDEIGPSYSAGPGLQLIGNTFSIPNEGVTSSMLRNGSVTPDKLTRAGASAGQILKYDGLNWSLAADDIGPGYSAGAGLALDANTFSLATVPLSHLNASSAAPGQVLTYNGSSVVWGSPASFTGWGLSGNAGTTPGLQFLGTTDYQPLELRVNNERVLRVEPARNYDPFPSFGYIAAPNVIGGHAFNTVGSGVIGATIGGGGFDGITSGGDSYFASNHVEASHGTIAGGAGNVAGYNFLGSRIGNYASVGGGYQNRAYGEYSTIPGGRDNQASFGYSFAAGRRAKAMATGSFVWADSSDADFQSTTANQFLIRASGGVGIGTDSPHAQLHVNASTASSADNTASFSATTIGPNSSHIHYGTTGDWYVRSADSSGKVILQDTGGKVGIGTTAPKQALHVQGDYYGHGHLWLYAFEGDGSSGNAYIQARDDSGSSSIGMVLRTQKDGLIRDALRLDPNGNTTVNVLTITGGADVAEPFQMTTEDIPKGAVLVIDDANPGKLKLSDKAYDRRVAGIVSGANGIRPGIALHQEGALEGGQNVALSGRVYALADAGAGEIAPGDLLTTSDVSGHAMRVTDFARAQGAIIGKAMTGLKADKGFVLVLVSLQ